MADTVFILYKNICSIQGSNTVKTVKTASLRGDYKITYFFFSSSAQRKIEIINF